MDSHQLPPSIQGDGRKFISLLKDVIEGIYDNYEDLIGKIKAIETKTEELETNVVDEYMKNVRVEEVRQDKNIKLTATWSPDYFSKYLHAEIWYCHYEGLSHDRPEDVQWNKVSVVDGAVKHVFEGVIAGHTYELKVLGVNKNGAKSNPRKIDPVVYYVTETQFTPDNPQLFQVSWQKGVPKWTWRQETNANYSYSELREDEHVGESRGMLDRTLDVKSDAVPVNRTGTVYLYNVGAGPVYSPALQLEYLKSVPLAPRNVTVENTATGIVVRFAAIPDDCTGAIISINGEEIKVDVDEYDYYVPFGVFDVKVAYYDCFGKGEWCPTIRHDSSRTIDKSWLDPEDVVEVVNNADATAKINANKLHITADTLFQGGDVLFADRNGKITATIQNGAVTADKVAAGAVTADKIATNAVSAETIQSGAITTDKIATGAITAGKVAAGSITSNEIASKAITSDKVATGAITANMITSGTLDASKVNVTNLNANNITSGTIRGDKVRGGKITGVRIESNSGRSWIEDGTIHGMTIEGSTISGEALFQSGFRVQNVDIVESWVEHNQKIPIPQSYSERECYFLYMGDYETAQYETSSSFYGGGEVGEMVRKYFGRHTTNRNDNSMRQKIYLSGRTVTAVGMHHYYHRGSNDNDEEYTFYTYRLKCLCIAVRKWR